MLVASVSAFAANDDIAQTTPDHNPATGANPRYTTGEGAKTANLELDSSLSISPTTWASSAE